ncbi:MAG: amino acid ABC transporter permease [Methanoregulaceae archaeon]
MDQMAFVSQILLPNLGAGLLMTLALIAITTPFGLALGTLVAMARAYGNSPMKWLARGFVVFFKGCPLLLLLFILYFGMPSIGIYLSPFVAAVLGFVLCNGAYNSEYIRGALHAIKEEQFTAAMALGMTRRQAIQYVILPQAIRKAFPGITNEFIYLIKYSSLAYMVTVIELTGAGKAIATKYFDYTEVFLAVGIIYLILVLITTVAAHLIEKRMAIPGQVAGM